MEPLEIDEYGRLVTWHPGLAGVTVGAAHVGPIVPPMPEPTHARSGRWPAVLKQELAANPSCRGCGRRAETAHHVVPFGVDPSRELDPANLVAVCVPCHFVLAHCSDWRLWVPTVIEDLARHLPIVQAAQKELHERNN